MMNIKKRSAGWLPTAASLFSLVAALGAGKKW